MSDAALAWLRAQLDDDERVARDFVGACWHVEYCDDLGPAFHARWDSARVLDEIEVKRAVLDWAEDAMDIDDDHDTQQTTARAEARFVLPLIAQPYADRPGFPEEWRA